METNSQVPIKRQISSSAGVVECIREFKLPQTFPSMAKDAKGDLNVISQSSVQLISKPSNIIQANIPLNDGQLGPKLQKLKLKSSDGRDLGEFDVQIVNQNRNLSATLNVQSKPNNLPVVKSDYKDNNVRKYVQLTAGKNSISSQSAAVKYLTKPIQVEVPETSQGVLIPIASNMMPVKTNGISENNQSSISVDSHKKKQVFLVQSTKNNWQVLNNGQTSNLSPIILKPRVNDDQVISTNTKQVKNVPQRVQLTHKSPVVTYKNDDGIITTGVKRKIDETLFKPTTVKDKKFVNIGNSNIVMKLEGMEENNVGDNVIYVVPSNDNLTENESVQNAEVIENKSKFLRNSHGRVNLIRKGRKNPLVNRSYFNKNNEMSLDHSSSYSLLNNDSLDDDPVDNDISSKLSIVGKALSTIGDEELKAKALKALADCGIGMERFVPTKPSPDLKSIKESYCQTNVFGLLDKKDFIKVDGESEALERIQEVERKKIDSIKVPEVSSNDTVEFSEKLNKMLDTFSVNKNNVEQMREIFKVHPIVEKAHRLIEKDFKNCKKIDKNGLLNIHKAVLSNQEKLVNRQIMVLKNCKVSVDLRTTDEQTSLELAVRHGISLEIIKMLLKAGASPTAPESHDSALTLASKQSSPILLALVPYLSSTDPAINNVDSEGFTALHYCAMNGYEEGVDELIRIEVDLNARDCKSGRTALFHALENKHLQICKKLLVHGAKGNIPNFAGQTVFALFDDEKHFILRDFLQRSIK